MLEPFSEGPGVFSLISWDTLQLLRIHASRHPHSFPGLGNARATRKFNLVASFLYLIFLEKFCATLRIVPVTGSAPITLTCWGALVPPIQGPLSGFVSMRVHWEEVKGRKHVICLYDCFTLRIDSPGDSLGLSLAPSLREGLCTDFHGWPLLCLFLVFCIVTILCFSLMYFPFGSFLQCVSLLAYFLCLPWEHIFLHNLEHKPVLIPTGWSWESLSIDVGHLVLCLPKPDTLGFISETVNDVDHRYWILLGFSGEGVSYWKRVFRTAPYRTRCLIFNPSLAAWSHSYAWSSRGARDFVVCVGGRVSI